MSDHPQVKKFKLGEEMTEIGNNNAEIPLYRASSRMLNDNEMLVTLQHNGSCSFMERAGSPKDDASNDQNTFEIEYMKHTYDEETDLELSQDTTSDYSTKIVTILPSDIVDACNHSVIIDDLYLGEPETDDTTVKTLTILTPVEEHNSDGLELVGISESVAFQSNDNFIIEQELGECGRNSGGTDLTKDDTSRAKQSTFSIIEPKPLRKVKKRNTRLKRRKKASKSVSIDLEKLTVPLNKKLKQSPVVQTYTHKKENKDTTKFNLGEKLYQKIPLPSKEEENADAVPEQMSVYDFYDEEEEKFKAEKAERDKEEKALKERTCMYCKEVFSDPIDVLRHKREFHNFRKVLVPREELEQYLKLENRTHCPLCYKEVCPLGYKSVYVKHLMVHCQDPGFVCRVCGIKFKRKDHLRSHEKRHVVEPKVD